MRKLQMFPAGQEPAGKRCEHGIDRADGSSARPDCGFAAILLISLIWR
jgi:hypothetical protein